ncbi:MAG TPA: penicillin-binding protein 2, partial [Clostridiaceae bacterium]|nr:penicillin-binding protein 2 [Clostridiaceae bacterium]
MCPKRGGVILILFTSLFLVLISRLFYLQVYKGEALAKASWRQRVTNLELDSTRGNITDRNLIPLTNRTNKCIAVLKSLYFRENKEELKKVCEIMGLDFNMIKREIEIKSVPLLFEIDEEIREKILNMDTGGVSVINSLKRYDKNSVAKHILGYLNKADGVGQTGVEKLYDDILRQKRENSLGVVTDAQNQLVEGIGYRIKKAAEEKSKLNIKLTIDYHMQRIVEEVMEKKNMAGAVIIEDIYSGDILAIASKPDFDQNNIEHYLNSSNNELFNRSVASYNLGSIFKIIDLACAFENEISLPEEFECTGSINVDGNDFKCSSYEDGGHGFIDLEKAFSLSCNPYFIKLGIDIGYRELIRMAQKFGLGSPSGILAQGLAESSGNLPDINSYYSRGDIANISIGQGEIMATPLQVVNIVATVANGGIKNNTNILDSVIDDEGRKVRELKIRKWERVISNRTADRIKRLMEVVTRNGTGIEANLLLWGGSAGKTGSAETGRENVVHAWFAGYFPVRNPRYAMVVFVEE